MTDMTDRRYQQSAFRSPLFSRESQNSDVAENEVDTTISSRPISADGRSGARTIDQFLEHAYQYGHDLHQLSIQKSNLINHRTNEITYFGMVLCMGLANASDATEILCLSYLLSNSQFQASMLHNDLAIRGSILAASVFGGMLLGGLLCGDLGDVHGRKPILLLGLRLNAVAGFFSALAPPNSVIFMSLLRFVAGLGIGATVPPLFTLATELSPPSLRGRVVTGVASFWMVGSIFVALVALVCFQWLASDDNKDATILGLTSWRFFAMICALPSAVASFLVKRHVLESPRFLAMQQARDQSAQQRFHLNAVRHVNQLASSMGVMFSENDNSSSSEGPQTLSPYTLQELQETFLFRRKVVSMSSRLNQSTLWSDKIQQMMTSFQKLYNRSRSLRRTTLLLQLCWFSLCFGTYGLLTWINTLFSLIHMKNPYVNELLFALANLPGNIVSFVLLDKAYASRSTIFASSLVAAAISLLGFAIGARDVQNQSANDDEGDGLISTWAVWMVVIFACAFQACTICSWNTIDTITSESFPTSSRSTGTGLCTASGRIGALVAQFVNGALLRKGDDGGNSSVSSSGVTSVIAVASVMLLVGALAPCASTSGDMTSRPLQDDIAKEHGESDLEEDDDDDNRKDLEVSDGFPNEEVGMSVHNIRGDTMTVAPSDRMPLVKSPAVATTRSSPGPSNKQQIV